MAKVNLAYDNMNTNCIDRLDSTIKYLNSILNYLQAFNIPSDFNRRTQLLNIISSLRKQKAQLQNARNSIINSNNDYNNVISSLNDNASKLPVSKIKKRSSII